MLFASRNVLLSLCKANGSFKLFICKLPAESVGLVFANKSLRFASMSCLCVENWSYSFIAAYIRKSFG